SSVPVGARPGDSLWIVDLGARPRDVADAQSANDDHVAVLQECCGAVRARRCQRTGRSPSAAGRIVERSAPQNDAAVAQPAGDENLAALKQGGVPVIAS